MSVYLVDYENVGVNGLNGIEQIDKEEAVHIFYSENADKLTFEMHKKISESKANIHYYRADVGKKNALDFQLATYLGYLIALAGNEDYYIVSKDETFSFLVKFWNKQNKSVHMTSNLLMEDGKKEQQQLKEQVVLLLPELKEEAEDIAAYIQKYKTKQGINNALVKKYKSERAGEIYKGIKSLLVEKKGR